MRNMIQPDVTKSERFSDGPARATCHGRRVVRLMRHHVLSRSLDVLCYVALHSVARLGRAGAVPSVKNCGRLRAHQCAQRGELDSVDVGARGAEQLNHRAALRGEDGDLRHGVPSLLSTAAGWACTRG